MLNNIQVLRGLAAFIVVVFHIVGASNSYNMPSEIFSLSGALGRSGVDIFFVISGFIMVYTQHNKVTTPLHFIKDRITRIVPIYWIFSLLFLALYFVMPSIFREFQPNSAFVISSFLFSSEWFFDKHPLLSVGWTLEYEMLFYVIFSTALMLKKQQRFIVPVILILLMPIFPHVDYVIYEFLLGMLVAKLYLVRKYESHGLLLFFTGIILFVLLNSLVGEWHRLIIFGLPAFFIVFGALYLPAIKNKILLHLGDASYSTYLIQVFTLPAFYKISTLYLNFLGAEVLALLALLSTMVAGSIFFLCLEKPITKALKSRKNPVKSVVVSNT